MAMASTSGGGCGACFVSNCRRSLSSAQGSAAAKWLERKQFIPLRVSDANLVRLARSSSRARQSLQCCAQSQTAPAVIQSSPLAARLTAKFEEFEAISAPRDRLEALLSRAASLPPLPQEFKVRDNRVMGCTAQVWLTAAIDDVGRMHFGVDSDAEITRGVCALLLEALNGAAAEELLAISLSDLTLPSVLKSLGGVSSSRTNTWYNVLVTMQKRTSLLLAHRQNRPAYDPFPSLVITADELKPLGDFAIAQARYLRPDVTKVETLVACLSSKRIGVVAHFYMDPEVQGVLVAAQKHWPHIHISDSLVMADRAAKMVEAGCEYIAVLGVDFMSENARAILDQAGYEKVPVYRMSSERISCSLADAADSPAYFDFLEEATKHTPSLHVIYINTSLETKARAQALVPTITCTSSNVVQTVLQAFAEVPGITVWYGPDSYMGANLAELFLQLSQLDDEEIATVHPLHNKRTIASLLPRLHYFNDGSCIVHDLFGKDVVARLRNGYGDAFQTAHFEVPGEMFALAMEAKQRGMGTVGSTQNILDFIKLRVEEAVQRAFDDKLQFILGTESGMITAIVKVVQDVLRAGKSAGMQAKVEVEIVFPVSSDAITRQKASPGNSSELTIVPGVASGEGCSMTGGCASCPYMKMNSLDSLLRVCEYVKTPKEPLLVAHGARNLKSEQVAGSPIAELGCLPILYMRHFQSSKTLPESLKAEISNKKRQST